MSTISMIILGLAIFGFLTCMYVGYKCVRGIGKAIEENDLMSMQLHMGILIMIVIVICN